MEEMIEQFMGMFLGFIRTIVCLGIVSAIIMYVQSRTDKEEEYKKQIRDLEGENSRLKERGSRKSSGS